MRHFSRRTSQANRGRFLEEIIRVSNERYKSIGAAIIEKVPTEWIPLRDGSGRIANAKVDDRNKGVPDFMGMVVGMGPVAFDAKETTDGARFPLSKIEPEQIAWLDAWAKAGGIAFTVHFFQETDRAYLLPFHVMRDFYQAWKQQGGKKVPASIDQSMFDHYGYRIRPGKALVLDYIASLKEWQG